MKSFVFGLIFAASSSALATSACNVYPIDTSGNMGTAVATQSVEDDGQGVVLYQTATDTFMAVLKPESMMVGMVDNATKKVTAAMSNGNAVAFYSAEKAIVLICTRQ